MQGGYFALKGLRQKPSRYIIFYVLDAEWDETKDPRLGEFLSGANPFLFADINSADPAIYAKFSAGVANSISIEESYKVASAYIASLKDDSVSKAFSSVDENEWVECVKDYLSQEHKGSEADN